MGVFAGVTVRTTYLQSSPDRSVVVVVIAQPAIADSLSTRSLDACRALSGRPIDERNDVGLFHCLRPWFVVVSLIVVAFVVHALTSLYCRVSRTSSTVCSNVFDCFVS